METDFLIIGSGVAGLTLAGKLAVVFPNKKVTVATKSHEAESNTKYAQGGVAVVLDLTKDSFRKHVEDTLIAGDGLCNKSIVEMVIKEGPDRVLELMASGAHFDTGPEGKLCFGKEGGHSESRIIHFQDTTGNEIERSLLHQVRQLPNIILLPHHFAIDLITNKHFLENKCKENSIYGAYFLDQISGRIMTIKANSTILATGGIGQVYGHTTNPLIATGDGIAMAYRAKAQIENMEFIQFHPTVFFDGKTGSSFLISEAVRGFGAFLRNKFGERFMLGQDARAELAPRDIVARAIYFEIKKTGADYVYLDCTHLNMSEFRNRFPTIYTTCLDRGIDLSKDLVPIVPAAHYLCGGIRVDPNGKTSVKNLFACGECAYTGLHGANRLASNSILEALVFARRICDYLRKNVPSNQSKKLPKWEENKGALSFDKHVLLDKTRALQLLMRNCAGIVRNNEALWLAKIRLELWVDQTEKLFKEHKTNTAIGQLRNMGTVAQLIIEHSLRRRENRGGFFNEDLYNKKIKEKI